MLAFDTDLAVPKDVSDVHLEAHVGSSGQVLDFKVGAADQKLPATFGLRTGDGKSKIVDVRLLAARGNHVRTVSSSKTTIPADRIARLRMPIDWLCTLRVAGDDQGGYTNDCDEGETCVAGRCVDDVVPEAELPTYDPADVFGGGVGDSNSGQCFRSDEAFGGQRGLVVTADIDTDTCRIKLDDAQFPNFALRVRQGDGICITNDFCLVTLNKDETTGWYEVNEDGDAEAGGGYAQLPPVVCDELGSKGAIIDVYEGQLLPQKEPGLPVCSPWDSAGTPDQNVPNGPDDPALTCPAAGSGKAGAEIVDDPLVATYLDVSVAMSAAASELLASAGKACVAIDDALNVEDVWSPLGYDAKQPTRDSVTAACSAAVDATQLALKGVARVKLGIAPEHCKIDDAAQVACESACNPGRKCPSGDRCDSADESATCSGTCDKGSVCEGSVDTLTACTGRCDGVCSGTCDGGLCLSVGNSADCEGFCSGNCIGKCAGDCTLTQATSCSTGTTCRGGCARSSNTTCGTALAPCDAVGPDCSALCATSAALGTTCDYGGTFSAPTNLPTVDASLEKILVKTVLPNLMLLDDVRNRGKLIADQEKGIDSKAILAYAKDETTLVDGCARAANTATLAALEAVSSTVDLAAAIVDPALDFEPEVAAVCKALENGTDCEQCISKSCCTELVNCGLDPVCLGSNGLSDPSSGEVPCAIYCVASQLTPGEQPTGQLEQQCAAECALGGTSLAPASVDMLECIGSNVNGCSVCYDIGTSGGGGEGGASGMGAGGQGGAP